MELCCAKTTVALRQSAKVGLCFPWCKYTDFIQISPQDAVVFYDFFNLPQACFQVSVHSRYPQCLVISNPRESSVEFRRELRCRRAWLFGVFVNSCDLAYWQYRWYKVSCFSLVKPLFWQPKQSVSGPHLDYFASSPWLSCIPTLTILPSGTHWMTPWRSRNAPRTGISAPRKHDFHESHIGQESISPRQS